ncbi:hypothetical protein TcasGA2_TC010392 [Tribolium castaneum]|uniref:Uncharacterized protein n=1 Tax=Tribolium castaneum TaxID=7070 RepID=D7GXR8_TRICA|nr:hypothetical protein TcasGA2_TC010392 [Tribolium castaneum]
MAVSSPPLTLEAIMGAMKTLLAPINERLQRLKEAVFADKASEAGSTSTVTGFSAHSLKSGESDLM